MPSSITPLLVARNIRQLRVGKIVIQSADIEGETLYSITRLHLVFNTFRATVNHYYSKVSGGHRTSAYWMTSQGRVTQLVTSRGMVEMLDMLSTSKSCKDWDKEAVDDFKNSLVSGGIRQPSDELDDNFQLPPSWSDPKYPKEATLADLQKRSDEAYWLRQNRDILRAAVCMLDLRSSKLEALGSKATANYRVFSQLVPTLFEVGEATTPERIALDFGLYTAWGTPATAYVKTILSRMVNPNDGQNFREILATRLEGSEEENGHKKLISTDFDDVIAYKVVI